MNEKSPSDRLAYVDLFAGTGRYLDGSRSTPLKVLDTALESPELRRKMVMTCNDADVDHIDSFSHTLNSHEKHLFFGIDQ